MGQGDGGRYVVCGCKPWCRRVFDEVLLALPGEWRYCAAPGELYALLTGYVMVNERGGEECSVPFPAYSPTCIFFTHWGWKVPASIYEDYNCINFHMTDLPYGRGGSPLQNLILEGKESTVVTAHRVTGELDGGKIVMRSCPVPLHGTAEEIYLRVQYQIASMVETILEHGLVEVRNAGETQAGNGIVFKRRTPEQSELVAGAARSLDSAYDFIRMLDADGYPRAYIDVGELRVEFAGAVRYMDRVTTCATIRRRKG